MTPGLSIGIDIGGTFTDVIVADASGGIAATLKTPSIPQAPEQAIFNAIEAAALSFAAVAASASTAATVDASV